MQHADDITLLALCKSALSILIRVCENYAAEYDIMFNGDKSKLLFFKGRSSVMMPSEIMVNGQIVGVSEKAVHLVNLMQVHSEDKLIYVRGAGRGTARGNGGGGTGRRGHA